MLHFYSGQVRKFLTQFMRILGNFSVETGRGKDNQVALRAVPVVYGDATRQVANIIRNNSENALNYAPKIACYIRGLDYDRERMQNPYHIEKQHLRERNVGADGNYTNELGAGYTVEKVMPSPFRLQVTADVYSSNTDQKLQIMEQILYLFNPDFEIQKSDNYIDWTSLSYVELDGITFSSRTIPVGAESEIDVATMTFNMPIWLSPPVKVKKLGVVQKIIMSIYDDEGGINKGLISGPMMSQSFITPNNFGLLVTGNQLRLLGTTGVNVSSGGDGFYSGATDPGLADPFQTFGPPVNWKVLLDQYGRVVNGTSQIRLTQPNGNEVIGTIATTTLDDTILLYTIDQDTIPANTLTAVSKIINPLTFDPGANPTDGVRYLITEDIGDPAKRVGKTAAQDDEYASDTDRSADEEGYFFSARWRHAPASKNDIIQWDANSGEWDVVWDASDPDSTQAYVTNLNTGIQYKFNDGVWLKSYEGIYNAGKWTIVLDGDSADYDPGTDATTP
jgi:hypothetical protein